MKSIAVQSIEGSGDPFVVAGVEVEVPETGVVQVLRAASPRFRGLFTPPAQPGLYALRVRLQGNNGEQMVVQHWYRLRGPGEGVVQRIGETGSTRFFALAIAPDGTVWAGGDEGATIARVPPGETTAILEGQLTQDPDGRVEDTVVDQLGRLHFLVFAEGSAAFPPDTKDVVLDQGTFCGTVNAFDPNQAYPFRVRDPQTNALRLSASTRVTAAGGGDIWLFGSDGGVARVADTFRDGRCPATGVTVRYAPVFRREDGGLLANTVPALVVGVDEALWFGTAFGLSRWQHGQFTALPFDPALSLRGNVATLEAFFRDVAQAIFHAQPLSTVAIGTVSFLAAFGSPLSKEDLIFSAVEDGQGQLWAGTLGGGIRRLEGDSQTLHLTRAEGLGSNLILALAVGPDDTVWAATDEGVSRIREAEGRVTITNFSALDGLALPVRDVAVDATGTAWLATDGGLFRIIPQGGQAQGVVRDASGRPVAEADVIVLGTPFRAVTDATGHFVLSNLPPGPQRLQMDGSLAVGGPFRSAFREVVVTSGEAAEEVVHVTDVADRDNLRLIEVAGNYQSGNPGEVLSQPLVVRLEDQFGNPVVGEAVTAEVVEGEGEFVAVPDSQIGEGATQAEQTDAQGEARFFLRVGINETDLVETRVSALDQEVRFLTLVGFLNPLALAVEADGALVVADTVLKAVVRVDPHSGARTLVSGRGRGSGPPLLAPWSIVVLSDGALVVADNRPKAVVRVDPRSGDRTLVSGCIDSDCTATVGSGPPFEAPQGLAVRADGTLVVVDHFLKAVVRVDLDTGNRSIVSGCVDNDCTATVGSGPLFVSPWAIAAEADGQVVVVDVFLEAVIRVHPDTGNRSVVSGCVNIADCTGIVGRGPAWLLPQGIAVGADGTLLVVDSLLNAMVRVDPRNGDRALASGCAGSVGCTDLNGEGPPFLSLRGITVEADGQLVVVDDGLDAVLRVDPGSGDRTMVSRAGSGTGTPFGGPVDIAVEATGQLVVVDVLLGAVLRIDPGSGARTVVSGCADSVGCADPMGSGLAFRSPQALAVETDGRLVVVDDGLDAVLRVDPVTGDRTLVSGEGKGSGLTLQAPRDIAVEAGGTLVVVDIGHAAVVRVDPATGNRTVVSDASTGSGLPFASPVGIAVEANGALIVTDFGLRTVVRVDPATGNRTLVSGRGSGGGPLSHPQGILVKVDGTLVVVDNALRAVLRVDPATGDRAIVSDASTGSGPSFVSPIALTIEANGQLIVVDVLLAAVVWVDPATGDRMLVSRLSLIPAAALAHVPTGEVRIRPIDDFLATQGTFCVDDGQGGCFLIVPPIPNFGAMSDGATNRCASVDYAGLANATVEDASGGRVSFGTTTQGLVIERPLADGRAKVAVLLATQNALTWVIHGCDDFAASPLLFGHRAADVLSAGRAPALGDSSLLLVFMNTAPGAPLPDFIQLVFFPEAGQEWNFLSFRMQADGPLREAFGVPDGTPGRATGRQINIFIPPFVQQNFLLEHIALRALGE